MLWIRLLLVLVTVGLYAPTLGFDFAWDDHDLVESNPAVRDPGALARLPALLGRGFASSPFSTAPGPYYRPLVVASFAVDERLGGGAPWAFHLTNVFLHAAVVFLLHLFLLRRGVHPPWALAGALLFAVHPVHAEPVAWIAGRTDVLAAFFFLAAWLAFLSLPGAVRAPGRNASRSWKRSAAVALVPACFVLALLSKEVALVLPLLLVGDLWSARRAGAPRRRTPVLLLGTLLLLALGYLGLRAHALRGLAPGVGPGEDLPARLARAPLVFGKALELLVAPWTISPLHDPTHAALPVVAALLAAAALAVTPAVLPSTRSALGFLARPAFLFALALLPVSGIVPLGVPFADRFLYLPSVAFVWALAATADRLPATSRKAVAACFAIIVVAFAARTATALPVWRNDVTLFTRILDDHPDLVPALNELGVALARRGETERARDLLSRAARIAPDFAPGRYNLARVYETLGETDAAITELRATLDLQPDAPGVAERLVRLLLASGRGEEAVRDLERAARRGSRRAAALLHDLQPGGAPPAGTSPTDKTP